MQSGCALWVHMEGCQGVMLPSDGDLECVLELQRGGIRGATWSGIKNMWGWYKDLPRVRKLTVPRGTV